MLRNIVRLLVLALVVHAGVRIIPVFWNYIQFRDAVREVAMFPGRLTDAELVARVIGIAGRHDVELAPGDVEFSRDGETIGIRTVYTKSLEYVPRRSYAWTFTIDVVEDPPRYGELIP